MIDIVKNYYKEIQELLKSKDLINEHTLRTPFENLLNTIAKQISSEHLTIIHEAKVVGERNVRPDFKIYKRVDEKNKLSYNALLGFIECKIYSDTLESQIKSGQIEKYLEICPNLILTNYNRLILFNYGVKSMDFTLFDYGFEKGVFEADFTKATNNLTRILTAFFSAEYSTIKTKAELLSVLSTQSFYLSVKLREHYEAYLEYQSLKDSKNSLKEIDIFIGLFQRTFETFNSIVGSELDKFEFCDILGQSVVYGLFVAHIENESLDKKLDIAITNLLPHSFNTLKEFIHCSMPDFALPVHIAYTIDNIKTAIKLIDKESISKDMKQKIDEVSIYLYEDFLKQYDNLRNSEKRKEGGVFYTPSPVVDCIVSSLEEILIKKLDKKDGFAEKEVKVLDFATGTGSFLVKVFEKILKSAKGEVLKQEVIKNKFLQDIYGFEISYVPYIVAHIKLRAILKANNFDIDNHKLQLFLTNTLDIDAALQDIEIKVPLLFLEKEHDESREIKNSKDLLVILGNPPYNVKSKNNKDKILKLLEDYKQGLNEQNIQPLNDDYIKFIRFAQWKLLENNKNPNNSKYGVMGFITNNSFIYGRTHRKMRESLFKGFDEIYILNLHGDSKRDLNDKNVFDIQQGVCISIFVKYQDSTSSCSVKYYSTYDNDIRTRGDKFALLSSIAYKGLESIKWLSLEPSEPYYWFINREVDESYEDFWALAKDESLGETKAIFNTHSSCITSSNDKIAIQFDKDSLKLIANDFYKLDSKEIAEKYKIKNKVDWDIQKVKNDITQALKAQENKNIDKLIKPIAYRPFDTRFTLYAGRQGFLGRPRASVMNQLAWQENIALCFPKTTLNNTFDYGFVVKNIADRALNGKNTASETYIAPLYTYNNMMQNAEKSPNFTDEFNEFIKRHKILKTKTPEEILAYIYATLHNPNYRKKYKENLKIGFPRIDFKAKKEKFEKFITLGQKLIKLHLLKNISQDSSIEVNFSKDANKQNYSKIIKKLKFSDRFKDSKLIINDDLEINGVGNEMANFSIGGYLVLDKYLSYRVGMEADLENLLDICNAIKETLEIYKELREIK